jgi:phosphate-selective porin OprO and OprP
MNLRQFGILTAAAAALSAGTPAISHAASSELLDVLVQNGTITQAQADELRKKQPVVVLPNRGTVTELKIRGRIQGQYAYSDGSNSGTAAGADDYSTFELRRVRLGVQGKVLQDWRFQVEANVLSSTDLDTAFLTYAANKEMNLTFGKDKPQFGYEENTSSASILTMERSRLTGLFNGGKPLGLRVHGSIDAFSYYAGVYNGQTATTGAMATNLDSFLFNASGALNLDKMVGSGNRMRFRLDYLRGEKASGYYRFKDAVAVSNHFATGPFDLRSEYMWGKSHTDAKTRGFNIMPSVFFTPKKLQGVLRYEQIRGDTGVNLGANRYAERVPGIYRSGNRYRAIYAGLNYYIQGDNLKLMAGIDVAQNKDGTGATSAKGRTTTFISGVRMQF